MNNYKINLVGSKKTTTGSLNSTNSSLNKNKKRKRKINRKNNRDCLFKGPLKNSWKTLRPKLLV